MKFKKSIAWLMSLLAVSISCSCAPLHISARDDTYGKFVFEEDSWRFPNASVFAPSEYYYSASDYQTLMQNMKNTEKWGAVQCFSGSWRGSCYGMAVLSVLACYDLVDYSQYCTEHGSSDSLRAMNPDPATGYTMEFRANEEEQSLINYYSNLQFLDCIRQHDAWNMYNTTDAERLQILIESVEDGSPAVLAFQALNTGVGHAVVAHGVEYGNYDYYAKGCDGRVLIYDVNYHFDDPVNYLYFNTEDWSWVFPRHFGSDEGMLLPVLNNVNLLNQGGLLGGTEPYVSENPFMDVFIVNEPESSYTLQQIVLQENGTWSRMDDPLDDYRETSAFYVDPILTAAKNFLLPGEEHGYVFDVESSQELDTAMYYENSIAHVYAGNAKQTVSDPSGYVGFSGMDTDFELELVLNENYVTDWYDISVAGHSKTASLCMTEDGYLLSADTLEQTSVTVSNDKGAQMIGFSANEDSVLIYETEYGALAIAADSDGNGSYDNILAEYFLLGDTDFDGEITASDASVILTLIVSLATDPDVKLTEAQTSAADVNSDGAIDPADASLVLKYIAALGAGNSVGSLTEFLATIG